MSELFIGIDPGQINQGVAVIDKNLKVIKMIDTGYKFPKELRGKNVPDIVKNSYVYYKTKAVVDEVKAKNIKMCVMEGANYSSTSNVTPISIGSIHGQNQMYFWDNNIDFMILPPRSIQVGVHDTSVDITKQKTKDKMREIFKGQIPDKGFSSNMSDALGMAYLARQFYLLMTGQVELSIGQQKIFLSKTKLKNNRRGLIYNFGKRLFIFNSNGEMTFPERGETLSDYYKRVKIGC
jgi:Holliday junction resolvasome RuvABC endonuclease subunit